ncbi:hypothetical protein N7454_010729 [Penicillium verhagenii]|nr:hypothetical protein N7454_010729 [Penicillium verhagenii]
MGLTNGRFGSESRQKNQSISSSQSGQPSIISDRGSQCEKSLWQRMSGKDKDGHRSSVNEQTEEILKTANHILTQLHEAKRLRQSNAHLLNADDKSWMDGTISDIDGAARDVLAFLEPTRVESATRNGKLSLGRQIRWVSRDNQRARDKTHRLLACHSSLSAVLTRLQRLNTPRSTSVPIYELGGEMPAKGGIYSSASLHDSVGGVSELEEGRRWISPKLSSLNVDNRHDSVACLSELGDSRPWISPKPSSLNLEKYDSLGGLGELEDTKKMMPPKPSPLNRDMHDLLAWRRSKGAAS